MKKIFAILVTICLMIGAVCVTAVTALADEPTAQVVIRVAGMKEDGSLILPESYASFEEGWERAKELAKDGDWMGANGIVRVVVDLYSDWRTNAPIEVPSGTSMMINMNGHTIDRGLEDDTSDGKVINMGSKSNLIINGGQNGDPIVALGAAPEMTKMGTITGGNSNNGACGIHINNKSVLTLNNVHLSNNRVEDDDGSAIAAYGDSVVVMNGGSISNNELSVTYSACYLYPHGALYLEDSTGYLTDVEISDNGLSGAWASWGVAICLEDSELTMENCLVSNNGHEGGERKYRYAHSIIEVDESILNAKNCRFENNGIPNYETDSFALFKVHYGTLDLTDCHLTNNAVADLIEGSTGLLNIRNTKFTDNEASIFGGTFAQGGRFTNCTFFGNERNGNTNNVSFHYTGNYGMTFVDCEWVNDNTPPTNTSWVTVVNSAAPKGVASILTKSSLNNIFSIVAIVCSVVAICFTVLIYKRETSQEAASYAAAAKAKEDEEDEEDDE